jgi:hypothetical protein
MTSYDKVKQRMAEDPEYRKQYLAKQAEANRRVRQRKAAEKTPEQKAEAEKRRIEAVIEANIRRRGPKELTGNLKKDIPSWRKGKPGRLVASCGWKGWGWK